MDQTERVNKTESLVNLLPAAAPADYSHVELTPDEEARALNDARMRKLRAMQEQESQQARAERIRIAREPWTFEEIRRRVAETAKNLPFHFEVDEDNKPVLRLLSLYFTGDPLFETFSYEGKGNYSLRKGIMLASAERGTGKTVLMELFSRNKRACFEVISAKKVASYYEATGEEVINRFSKPWIVEPQPKYFYQSPVGICFDDLGDEEIKNHYGNKENVMQRILQRVYDDRPEKDWFNYFHVTTNLSGDELEQRYDKRVRSRMREMFNYIELPGKDRRR